MRGMMTKVLAWTAAWLLPLATMADVPPMSRAEWEQARQFSRMFTLAPAHTLSGYALVGSVGVVLIVGLIVLAKRYPRNWNDFQERWIMLAIVILIVCFSVEFFFGSFSRLFAKNCGVEREEESYETYLFYESHCRCGSPLDYVPCVGRCCLKCHPELGPEPATLKTTADRFCRQNASDF